MVEEISHFARGIFKYARITRPFASSQMSNEIQALINMTLRPKRNDSFSQVPAGNVYLR